MDTMRTQNVANTDADAVILRAIAELEEQRNKIESRIEKLREALGEDEKTTKGGLSAAVRKKISESQRQRWAERNSRKEQLQGLKDNIATAREAVNDPLEELAQKSENSQ